MINWSETNIILAVIGIVGLLSTFTIIARSMYNSHRYWSSK